MEKIASFKVDHTRLKSGLYVSRKDKKGDVTVTTFDMRITEPNMEPVVDMAALHTIEHLGATYLRNSEYGGDVVYFGPMGCRTGFYIVMFGDTEAEDAYPMVLGMLDFIISFEGEIPGAKPDECGNYLEQNLGMAKHYIREYRDRLTKHKRFSYPE